MYPSSLILLAHLKKIMSYSEILLCKKLLHKFGTFFMQKIKIGTWILLMGTFYVFIFRIYVCSNLFFTDFKFFQDFDLDVQFLALLNKKSYPDELLMLFRQLTYWCSLLSHGICIIENEHFSKLLSRKQLKVQK